MTKSQLQKLLNVWKTRLGLTDWRILLSFEECEDKASYMEVVRSSDYKRAKIIVSPWMIGIGNIPEEILFPPADQWPTFVEESLVHELLHIVITEMDVIVRNDIDTFLHRDVYTQVYNAYRHAEERMVDNLAISLVRSFK